MGTGQMQMLNFFQLLEKHQQEKELWEAVGAGKPPPRRHFPCPRETSAQRKEKVEVVTAKEEAQG